MHDSRIAVHPPDGRLQAVERSPLRLRLLPPTEPVDVARLATSLRSAGVDLDDVPDDALAALAGQLTSLYDHLAADPALARQFDEDPGSVRDIVGDDTAELLIAIREQAEARQSELQPPGSGDDTRWSQSPRTPGSRDLQLVNPAVEERVAELRGEIVAWALADPDHLAAFRADPGETVQRIAEGESPAVIQALVEIYEATAGESDA